MKPEKAEKAAQAEKSAKTEKLAKAEKTAYADKCASFSDKNPLSRNFCLLSEQPVLKFL